MTQITQPDPRTLSTKTIFDKLEKVFTNEVTVGRYRAELLEELRYRCELRLVKWQERGK